LRKKEYDKCLEEFFYAEQHFDQIIEEQYDFHGYCMRKFYLRSYLEMIRLCDNIYSQKFYFKVACGIVEVNKKIKTRLITKYLMKEKMESFKNIK
jgi:N-alpha-acetyltransferase 15/16, NatA auxiliary subunit